MQKVSPGAAEHELLGFKNRIAEIFVSGGG